MTDEKIKELLTDEQKEAIRNEGGQLLVSAAAGSGKTKVLVDRLMRYIMDPIHPVNIDDFLIITYTKAAAAELRVKIGSKLSDKIAENPNNAHLQEQMQRLYLTKISTIHSFCSDVLRRYAHRLDIPVDFRQAEENESVHIMNMVLEQVLEEAYENIAVDSDFRAFVDTQGYGRNDRSLSDVIFSAYRQSVNFPDPDKWLDDCAALMDVSKMTDVSQTKWGNFLMEQLFEHLDRTIPCMEEAVEIAKQSLGGDNVAAGLEDSLQQLRHLRSSKTWDEILARKHIEYCRLSYKKGTTQEEKDTIRFLRDLCKNGVEIIGEDIVDPSSVILEELKRTEPAVRGLCSIVKRFAASYSAEKKRRRLMDYSDLEQMCLTLFRGKNRDRITVDAREVGRIYHEVMIDEYQDSNAVQDAIFSAITDEKKNCFMVGDVKQSIYQFRQADPGIFLKKYNSFVDAKGAADGEGRRVLLSKNFRSTDDILQGANSVFETCMSPELGGLYYDDKVSLQEGRSHSSLGEPGVELYVMDGGSKDDEAVFVAERIQELVNGEHYIHDKDGNLRRIRYEDIAVLMRSPNYQEEPLVQALQDYGIRYVTTKDVPLLMTQENMLLVALLRVINNPQLDIPLTTVLCSPVFAFTADDLSAIRSQNKRVSLYDAIKKSDHPKAKWFVDILTDLRSLSRMAGVCQIMEEIFIRTGMTALYSAMEDGEKKLQNIEALYQHAAEFEGWGRKDLTRFVEHLDSMDPEKMTASQSKQNNGCVTLTSIHKSKGLEYPVVFLYDLSRPFSTNFLRNNVFTSKDMGFGVSTTEESQRIQYPTISKKALKHRLIQERNSEEMRVLYVAMTRPIDRLIMTYNTTHAAECLREAVLAHNLGLHDLVAKRANCLGDWVLLSAVKRLEAGEIFHIAGSCDLAQVQKYPWLIKVIAPPERSAQNEDRVTEKVSDEVIESIREMRDFQYPFVAATAMPSKQTATQRNREQKEKPVHYWRKPGVRQTGGSVYGNIIHSIMEHLDYSKCETRAGIIAQLDLLHQTGLLNQQERDAVDVDQLVTFFKSHIGQKLLHHPNVLREFQFTILDAPDDPMLSQEKVLLQGVVDCAMVDDDGIVILDFKTDKVSDSDVLEKVEHYRPQLKTYATALSRIYEKPVKSCWLYFFRLGKTISL